MTSLRVASDCFQIILSLVFWELQPIMSTSLTILWNVFTVWHAWYPQTSTRLCTFVIQQFNGIDFCLQVTYRSMVEIGLLALGLSSVSRSGQYVASLYPLELSIAESLRMPFLDQLWLRLTAVECVMEFASVILMLLSACIIFLKITALRTVFLNYVAKGNQMEDN